MRFARWVALTMLLLALPAFAAPPFSKGAVAAAHSTGSAAGKEMLDAGGNAIDAAVAAAFTMAVVGPYHSGLGGGGFAVVHLAKEGKDLAFDFREVAPKGASRDMYVRDGAFVPALATDGALSVAVPGAVKGYLELHAKYGRLPRAKVLAPAIRAATQGFPVTPRYVAMAKHRERCLASDPEAARIFLRPGVDGGPVTPALGTLLKQPELAKTLWALAKQGDTPFYQGAIGKAVADTVQRGGGVLTREDLQAYATRWREPLTGTYRGHRVVTMPPPSAGGVVLLQVLGMLEQRGPLGPSSRDVDTLHAFIEALRLAFVDRAVFMGDPAFTKIPLEKLLARDYLTAQLKRIDSSKATKSTSLMPRELAPPKPEPAPGAKNTTHLSVVDAEGNAVALTTTVNYSFGSCVVAKGTGVLLNDEMDDFAGQPGAPNSYGLIQGEPNAIAPGKIPLSSMTPTLVFMKDDASKVLLAVGSPGGSTIPTTVLQVLSQVVDAKLDVVRAAGEGRLHHQWMPDEVWVEPNTLDPATAAALKAKGHTLRDLGNLGWGDAEAVLVDPSTGLRTAASDPRNEGAPSGQ
ncbi:MAG: gamma-glutamyltransferase [Myxococcales bacterium]|nr:gamma-glutamyltransferase [Myxococcales bacterium]